MTKAAQASPATASLTPVVVGILVVLVFLGTRFPETARGLWRSAALGDWVILGALLLAGLAGATALSVAVNSLFKLMGAAIQLALLGGLLYGCFKLFAPRPHRSDAALPIDGQRSSAVETAAEQTVPSSTDTGPAPPSSQSPPSDAGRWWEK